MQLTGAMYVRKMSRGLPLYFLSLALGLYRMNLQQRSKEPDAKLDVMRWKLELMSNRNGRACRDCLSDQVRSLQRASPVSFIARDD